MPVTNVTFPTNYFRFSETFLIFCRIISHKTSRFMKEWRLYLDEVRIKIEAETIEQAKQWCISRQLPIYDEGFKEYVHDYEFELAYDLEYIVTLITEYGAEWFKYYTSRESKTHIPLSKITEITINYPAIKNGSKRDAIQSSILSNLDNQTFTIKEAAVKLAVCDKTIRNAIKSGSLVADISNRGKSNKRYIISAHSLDDYLTANKAIALKDGFSNKSSLKNFHKAA